MAYGSRLRAPPLPRRLIKRDKRNVTRINTTRPPPDSRMIDAYKDRSYKPFMDPHFAPADCTYAKLRYSYPLKMFPNEDPVQYDFLYFLGNQLEAFDDGSNYNLLPVGYEKYYPLYNKYEVYGCAIEITAYSTELTNNALIVLAPVKANTPPDSQHGILDIPYAKWKVIGPGTGPSVCKMKSYMTTSKLYGFPANTDLALVTTLPPVLGARPSGGGNLWAWTAQFLDVGDNFAGGVQPNCSVKLTWYVKFFDRKDTAK